MRAPLVLCGLVLMLISTGLIPAYATGRIALYFDQELTQVWEECPDAPPGSVLDTLYVAISGFTSPVEGIEYRVLYPPEITWVGDVYSDRGLVIAATSYGISMAFFEPLDAYNPIIIQEIIIIWNCDECEPYNSIPIELTAHPATGYLRAVTSDLVFEDVVGYPGWICYPFVGHNFTELTPAPLAAPASPLIEQCVFDCPAGDGGVIIPGDPPGVHHTVDLDADGAVSIVDFSLFIIPYTTEFDPNMDFYCSGNLDLLDFVLFTRHYLHTGSVPIESRTWGGIKAQYSQ
jgi:hypothetical protein